MNNENKIISLKCYINIFHTLFAGNTCVAIITEIVHALITTARLYIGLLKKSPVHVLSTRANISLPRPQILSSQHCKLLL